VIVAGIVMFNFMKLIMEIVPNFPTYTCAYIVESLSPHVRLLTRLLLQSSNLHNGTPSDPYYSSLIRMYLLLKCV
jgi:hypothetical protein